MKRLSSRSRTTPSQSSAGDLTRRPTQHYCCVVLPALTKDGLLPPGIHLAEWDAVYSTFGTTRHRRRLLDGFRRAINALKKAGCKKVYLDGSFVTGKVTPGDFDFKDSDFTIYARNKTREGGTILAHAPLTGKWQPNYSALFVRDGRLVYDIGWVGAVTSKRDVDDDEWHDIVMTYRHERGNISFYIDGKLDTETAMKPNALAEGVGSVRLGFTAPDFPVERTYFLGSMAEVRFYRQALKLEDVATFFARVLVMC